MSKGGQIVMALTLAVSLLGFTGAEALDLGDDITIWDGMGSGTGWTGTQEDQEVEPGNVQNQSWDLEGFFLNGTTLTMVGGFDFINGNQRMDSGDIFLDVNGDAQYGPTNSGTGGGTTIVSNTFGYDYVLDLNLDTLTYDVLALTDATTVTVYYGQNDESNPWRYNAGGQLVGSGAISYTSGLSDAEVGGLLGGNHNALAVDLGFLGAGNFTSHFTMECGNDNLMGRGAIVPEPASVTLLGLGLAGMAVAAYRRRKQS